MEKVSYGELVSAMRAYNKKNDVHTKGMSDVPRIYGAVVFKESTFSKVYPLDSRTYIFSNDNKAFIAGMGGYSIYSYSKDGTDVGVRLEQYCQYEHGDWEVDYCYFCDKDGEPL